MQQPPEHKEGGHDPCEREEQAAGAMEGATAAHGRGAMLVVGRAELAGLGEIGRDALALEEPGAVAESEVFEFGGADVSVGHGGVGAEKVWDVEV